MNGMRILYVVSVTSVTKDEESRWMIRGWWEVDQRRGWFFWPKRTCFPSVVWPQIIR